MPRRAERRTKRLLWRAFLAAAGPADPDRAFEGPLRSAVILAQEKLGDAILLTPLFRNLRRAFPDLRLDVVTYGLNGFFFERDPNVSLVLHGKRDYVRYFRTLKSRRYDLLFSTKDHPSFTFLYQARVIPARFRLGLAHPMHRGFFNRLLDVDFHRHVVEKNCALLGFLGVPPKPADLRPSLPDGPVRPEVEAFARSLEGRGAVGINLSAGGADREWPAGKWEALAGGSRRPVVVFAMTARSAEKRRLERGCGRVIASPETRSIFEAGRVLSALSLLVSPDTALVHAASAVSVPVVGLYKSDPVHRERFYPYGVPHRVVASATRRVEDIPVEAVRSAMAEVAGG